MCCAGTSSGQLGSSPSPLTLQLSDELGLSLEDLQVLDSEGRALITDHGLFLLVNLYGELVKLGNIACLPARFACTACCYEQPMVVSCMAPVVVSEHLRRPSVCKQQPSLASHTVVLGAVLC